MLPPEAKLGKVPIPPTMLTMEGFRFWLLFWILLTVNFRQPSYEFTFNVGIDLLF
jgi:hypothetical protein